MIIRIDTEGTIEGFKNLVCEMESESTVEGILILTCDGNEFTPDDINGILRKVTTPLFGGIFPGIIQGGKNYEKGTIVVGISKKPDIHIVSGLSNDDLDFNQSIDEFTNISGDGKTMFVFVDGYSQRISPFIDNLYNTFGTEYSYIGGGAGSINPSALDMTNTPCLLTNDGVLTDSAILAVSDIECGVGVGHGWHKISGPYKVTETDGTAIISLDWKPAFEVYSQIIKEQSGKEIRSDNFFEIAKSFPLGISRLDSEIIVRDLFTEDKGKMMVATEIPQESFVDILTGNPESIIKAAGKSSEIAMESLSGKRTKTIFLIDCISRALYLGDEYVQEVDAVKQKDSELIGILSLGEIAHSGTSYMELYNKTCVVGVLGE